MNKTQNCRELAFAIVFLASVLTVLFFSSVGVFSDDTFAAAPATDVAAHDTTKDSAAVDDGKIDAAIAVDTTADKDVADFTGSALIKNEGDKQYKAIRLSAEIYRNSQMNLADLRIFDANGQVIPYFIHRFSPQTTMINQIYQMREINSFVKEDFYYLDYAVNKPKNENEDILATSLEVSTPQTGFAKKAELWGSYDNLHWEKIVDDLLYRVDGNEKLEIFLGSRAKKYIYYRFKIANNLEKVDFSSVVLKYNNIILNRENFTEFLEPQYTVEEEEKGKRTLIKISGVRNLKIDSITIDTADNFKRKVSIEDRYQKMLYNLNFQNTSYRDTTLPLDGYRTQSDTVVLAIENHDDQPIQINKVFLKYYVDEIVFNGASGSSNGTSGSNGTLDNDFQLKFGNEELTVFPSYDLVNYQDQILLEGYDLLSIQDLKIHPRQAEAESTQSFDPKMLFNVVIVLVAVVLGVIILLKLKNIK